MASGLTAALLGMTHPHSQAHLRTLLQLPEIERILLWDSDPQAMANAGPLNDGRIEPLISDLAQLLGRADLSFVIVCVPTDLAPALCLQAIAAGKAVLAEKPIGRSAAEVDQVVLAAEQAGLPLGVCYQNRRNPISQAARELIAAGTIGPLTSVEMRLLTTQVCFRDPNHWLFQQAIAGGGVLSWLGCHDLDLMRYVTGDEIVAVSAEVATRSGEAIDVEDVAVLALRFRSGAVGSLHIAYALALHGGGYHNPGGYDTHLSFVGRNGRLYWSNETPQLHIESATAPWRSAPIRTINYAPAASPAYGGVYGEEFLRDFIGAVNGAGAPPATGRDALQVARIVEAAYESSRSGRRLDITI